MRHVVNINADPADVQHYNATTALMGDAAVVCERLAAALAGPLSPGKAAWLAGSRAQEGGMDGLSRRARCAARRASIRCGAGPVLTQPQAIAVADRFCREKAR